MHTVEMKIAKAVLEACIRANEKSRSLNNINIEVIVERVMSENLHERVATQLPSALAMTNMEA